MLRTKEKPMGLHFCCARKAMLDALGKIIKASAKSSTMPILSHVLLEADENCVWLTGYNLEFSVKVPIDAEVLKQGSLTVHARELKGHLMKFGSAEICVQYRSRLIPPDQPDSKVRVLHSIKVTDSCSRFSMVAEPASAFPEIPGFTAENSFSIGAQRLGTMLKQVQYAVGKNSINLMHSGVLFDLKDKRLHVVATDRYQMSLRQEEIRCAKALRFVVPGEMCMAVAAMASKAKSSDIQIHTGAKHARFEIDGGQVQALLVRGEYFCYEEYLQLQATVHAEIPRDQLLISTKLVMQEAGTKSGKNQLAYLKICHAYTRLSLADSENMHVIRCETVGLEGEAKLTIPLDRLHNVVQAFTSDTVRLRLLDNKPNILCAEPGDGAEQGFALLVYYHPDPEIKAEAAQVD